MSSYRFLGILSDLDSAGEEVARTRNALHAAATAQGVPIHVDVVRSRHVGADAAPSKDGWVLGPGSPFERRDRVLAFLRSCRRQRIPLLGTCAGFHHVVLEFVRHSVGMTDAEHTEYDPDAWLPLIHRPSCSAMAARREVLFREGSRVARAYQGQSSVEEHRCTYYLNPRYRALLDNTELSVVGEDHQGTPEVVELRGHPFYVASLFLPQLHDQVPAPPLFRGLVEAAKHSSMTRDPVPTKHACDREGVRTRPARFDSRRRTGPPASC